MNDPPVALKAVKPKVWLLRPVIVPKSNGDVRGPKGLHCQIQPIAEEHSADHAAVGDDKLAHRLVVLGLERSEETEVVAEEHPEVDGDDQHRAREGELVHVRPGHVTGDDAARDDAPEVEEEGEPRQARADTRPQ